MDAKEKITIHEKQTVLSVKITDLKDIDEIFTQGYSSETIYGCLSMIAPMINPGNPGACIPNGTECLNQRKIRRELQHAERVSYLCECIGNHMGLNPAMIKQLKVSGFVHDIGKMKIGIVNKSSVKTNKELCTLYSLRLNTHLAETNKKHLNRYAASS